MVIRKRPKITGPALVFVLMPSHLHPLMGFRGITQLSRVMQTFKSLSARRLKPLLSPEHLSIFEENCCFQFWKPRFDDVVIWSEKQFRIKVDYIHNNPVKAGLVGLATDYVMSSAGDWLLEKPGLISIDKNWSWLEQSAKV